MERGIYFENKKRYLKVSLSGTRSVSDIEKFAYLTKEECEKNGLNKVLVDGLSVDNTNFSMMDSFLLGEILSDVFPKKSKIVIIWPKENINNILETVAGNKGVEIKVIDDMDAGLEWLLQKEKRKWFWFFNS